MRSLSKRNDWHNRYERDTCSPIPTSEDIDDSWRLVKSVANPDGGFNGGIDLVVNKHDGLLAVRKRLRPRPRCTGHDHMRWRREMLVLRKLDHHNIPKYYDGFFTPERGSLYMQPCRLGSVSDFVDSHRKKYLSLEMQEFFLWYILHEVAEAVLYMQTGFKCLADARRSHRDKVKGWVSLVHGDIRPDQIFLNNTESDPTTRVMLGDFGFAQFIKPWHSCEVHDGPGGKSSSKAPEFPSQISTATDIFGLGAVAQLYIAPCEKVKAGLNQGWLSQLHVSKELDSLVCRLVAVQPADRPTIREALQETEWGLKVREDRGLGLSLMAGPLFKCLYAFPRTALSN
ncbi:hypothetical protein EPUS_03586 [Endocarpon pusillum Z07020]|uniref:non-specific serine/threonine protein kinase n=1 Tax=Endocarpon pusillum (strain Z07020 / HMAS-L-300199) TaxID=1263415 RepID=U1HM06_ENDPU|nr:uncharacterized protein EPUS_03586 [Endocarpon pusillum Z07020]ERF70034.1 hypothetical protein EPUS_03586 [Endocarpon pusillum Z07020]